MFASIFGFGATEEQKPEVTDGEEQKPEVVEDPSLDDQQALDESITIEPKSISPGQAHAQSQIPLNMTLPMGMAPPPMGAFPPMPIPMLHPGGPMPGPPGPSGYMMQPPTMMTSPTVPAMQTTPVMPPQAVSADEEERIESLRAENDVLEKQLLDLKAEQNEQDSQQVLANLRDGLNQADQSLRDLQERARQTFEGFQMEIDTLREQIHVKTNLANQYEQEIGILAKRQCAQAEESQTYQQAAIEELAHLKAQNQSRDMKLADLKIQLDRVNNRMAANAKLRSGAKAAAEPSAVNRNPEFVPLQPGEPLFPYKCRDEDPVDVRLADIFNRVASHVKVTRINRGLYKFAHVQCELAIINNKLLVKVEDLRNGRPAWNFCKYGHFDRFLSYIENECYGKCESEY